MTVAYVTRRTLLGTGMAALSIAGSLNVSAYGQTLQSACEPCAIDAMLIDRSIAMPGLVNAFISARRQIMPVMDIQLDAAAYRALRDVLTGSQTLIGVSSGATLFCLERIALDYGFRLTARHQLAACDLDGPSCHQSALEFLNAAHPTATSPFPRGYRPSRADGTLHAWTMRKSARPHFSQDRWEA